VANWAQNALSDLRFHRPSRQYLSAGFRMTAAGHGGPNRNIFPIAAASASVAGQPTVRIFHNNRRPAFETSGQQTTRAHLPRSVAPEVTRPTDRRHSRAIFERREGRRTLLRNPCRFQGPPTGRCTLSSATSRNASPRAARLSCLPPFAPAHAPLHLPWNF